MSTNPSTEIADSETTAGNLTSAELVNRLTFPDSLQEEIAAGQNDKEAVSESEEISEPDENNPEQPEETQETEEPKDEQGEDNQDDVLSQFDIDSLTDEQILELTQREDIKSRLLQRVGQLTARAKSAEEKLSQVENKPSDPLTQSEIKDNPLSDLTTIDQLREKAQEIDSVIEWAEDLLFESDDYGPGDVVTTIEGKELTKSNVRESLKNARKSRNKYLPDQLRKVQEAEQRINESEAWSKKAKEELNWMSDEESAARKGYDSIVNHPDFSKVEKALPHKFAVQFKHILAHYVNSVASLNQPKEEAPQKPDTKNVRLKPPGQPGTGGAAVTEKRVNGAVKSMLKQEEQFRKTGSSKDLEKLIAQQIQNKT